MHDWLDTRDIAQEVGLKQETLKKYRLRGAMPKPDRYFGKTPVWSRETITQWHESRVRHKQH
jgi:predicted DNA-binding transcriptional regulator AlpA